MHNPFFIFISHPTRIFVFVWENSKDLIITNSFQSETGNVVHGYAFVHDFDPKSKYEKFKYKGMNKLLNNLPATKSRRKKAIVDSSIIDLSIMFLSK
jgi:hypothetical protein